MYAVELSRQCSWNTPLTPDLCVQHIESGRSHARYHPIRLTPQVSTSVSASYNRPHDSCTSFGLHGRSQHYGIHIQTSLRVWVSRNDFEGVCSLHN